MVATLAALAAAALTFVLVTSVVMQVASTPAEHGLAVTAAAALQTLVVYGVTAVTVVTSVARYVDGQLSSQEEEACQVGVCAMIGGLGEPPPC